MLYVQYYDDTFSTAKEQKAFEKNLFNKTHRANGKVWKILSNHVNYAFHYGSEMWRYLWESPMDLFILCPIHYLFEQIDLKYVVSLHIFYLIQALEELLT